MRINGATERLGDWNKGRGPLELKLGPERKWLTEEVISPWELPQVRFCHTEFPKDKLVYKYSLFDKQSGVAVWEREPSRELKIRVPEEYGEFRRTFLENENIEDLVN